MQTSQPKASSWHPATVAVQPHWSRAHTEVSRVAVATDVFVIAEGEGGGFRVSDRQGNRVLGPFPTEAEAVQLAFSAVAGSPRWEIHVLDRFGTLVTTWHSQPDGRGRAN